MANKWSHERIETPWPRITALEAERDALAARIEELELEVETWKSRALHQNEVAGRLEAKLAQQDALIKERSDEVQAAVAAALREAADAVEDYCSDAPDLAGHGHSGAIRDVITALITPDAQAALDRVVAAERERCAKVAEQKAGAGSHAIAGAIRKGGRVMPRYIIECDDPTDIILGMRSIKNLIKSGDVFGIIEFEDDSLWVVNKTKTGYSARTTGGQKDA